MKNKIIAIMIMLLMTTPAYADLFSDIHIKTDEDAYVNININSTADVNLSETWNHNEYYTTVSSGGYSRKRMLNDQSEILDHFTGFDPIGSLDRWQKRYVSSLARLVYAIYEQVYGAYFKIMNQEVRAHGKAITKLESRIKELEALNGIEQEGHVSVLCESLIEVMNEDNETDIVCKNGHGLETWHSMNINGDKGAVTLLNVG
jgi:hypothetical protein